MGSLGSLCYRTVYRGLERTPELGLEVISDQEPGKSSGAKTSSSADSSEPGDQPWRPTAKEGPRVPGNPSLAS